MSDLVVPGERVLPLSDGKSITVKAKLNAGETYDLMGGSVAGNGQVLPGEIPQVDPNKASFALVLAYLLAWNLTDDAGQVLPLPRPVPDDADNLRARRSAIRAIEFDRFTEILEAITAHDATHRKKKLTLSAIAFAGISPSPNSTDGGTSGLTPLTPTST